MSGIKRRTVYRKNVTESTYSEIRELLSHESILKVGKPRGGNLFEVIEPDGQIYLAMLPSKFKNLIWVKRGDYVIVESASKDYMIAGGDKGKVKYLITHILQKSQIQYFIEQKQWPEEYEVNINVKKDDDYQEDIFTIRNTNRVEVEVDEDNDEGEESNDQENDEI